MNVMRIATLCAVLLAFAGGCKREEPKPSAPPPPPTPQTAPQPAPPPTAAPGTTEPGRTVGQTVDDATITAKVKAALLQADDVKGLAINVDTMNGVVTLKGAVDTPTQVDRAVSIAKVAEGVKEVKSELTVKARAK